MLTRWLWQCCERQTVAQSQNQETQLFEPFPSLLLVTNIEVLTGKPGGGLRIVLQRREPCVRSPPHHLGFCAKDLAYNIVAYIWKFSL